MKAQSFFGRMVKSYTVVKYNTIQCKTTKLPTKGNKLKRKKLTVVSSELFNSSISCGNTGKSFDEICR